MCEAKATMSTEKDWWDCHIKQLQRYDDDLVGWWTDSKCLENDSNTILLVSSEKSIKFRKHVEDAISKESVSFTKPIAFVGFIQTGTPQESMLFQLDWGKIYNSELHEALEDRKLIPLEHFVASVDRVKFYDSPPPVEYMMEVLWNHVFIELKTAVKMDEESKTWPIDVNIPNLTRDVQKLYGQTPSEEREASFPNIKWIRSAVEHFEVLGLAKKKDLDNYTVGYKNLRGDLLERFSKARKKVKEKEDRKRQMELPLTAKRRGIPAVSNEFRASTTTNDKPSP